MSLFLQQMRARVAAKLKAKQPAPRSGGPGSLSNSPTALGTGGAGQIPHPIPHPRHLVQSPPPKVGDPSPSTIKTALDPLVDQILQISSISLISLTS